MAKIVRITESQLNDIIRRAIKEQYSNGKRSLVEGTRGMAKPLEDKYHRHWDKEDTILSWYCTKYPNHIAQAFGLGQTTENEKNEIDPLAELANYYIGTSKFSLTQQMGNLRFVAGMPNGLNSASNLQKEVYAEYGHMSEEELREVCQSILDDRFPNINVTYEKFIAKFQENMETSAANKKAKTEKEKRQGYKTDSERKRDEELRKIGRMVDPNNPTKVIKIPPKPYL